MNSLLKFNLVMFLATINLAAKIGMVQSKDNHKINESMTYGFKGKENDQITYGEQSNLVSDQEALDEISESLPKLSEYLAIYATEKPHATSSLSVKSAKDQIKKLSKQEMNQLFLDSLEPQHKAERSKRIHQIKDAIQGKDISGRFKNIMSHSAANHLKDRIDHKKFTKFVNYLPDSPKK